jgi:TPR repeat protein
MKMATDMYLKGAKDEEDGYCCTQLGNICVEGRGIGMDEPDYEAAAKYYIAAIRNDDPMGYANIAKMYEHGFVNGKKDKETAIKWYQLGAILGEEHCVDRLKKLGVDIAENPDYDFSSLAKELYAHVDTSGESL